MDDDHTKGVTEHAKGSLKEAIGKVTGNAAIRAEGAAQKGAAQRQAVITEAKEKGHKSVDGHD